MNPVVRTLHSYLEEIVSQEPQKRLLGDSSCWLDAQTVLERSNSLATYLLNKGISQGDYVVLRTKRNVRTALLIFALQAMGAVTVLMDPRQNPQTFLDSLSDTLSIKAVLDPDRIDIFNLPVSALVDTESDPTTPGFLIFTSGSTGKPKAVMLSQYNLVNNLIDSAPLGYYQADDIALGALPMDHVFGLVLLAGVCVLGYSIYFPELTDIPCILQSIQRERVTRMNGVPSLYLAMVKQASNYDLRSLRAGFIGGGPCTEAQFQLIESVLDMTLIPVYGMSECIGISCASYKQSQAVRSSGVGAFYSMNLGMILLPDGTEADTGEEGEICVRGPARMVGYYPHPIPEDAFIHTGDLGYLDSMGILHLTGRKKDIIIRNGNNLSAQKIEEALLSIDGVADAAVVGLPDELSGEVPVGMIVCPEGCLRGVWIQLHTMLQKNEIPKELIRVPALPRTSVGKPDKHKIREVLMKWKA